MKMDKKEYYRQYYIAHPEIKEKARERYRASSQLRVRRAKYMKEYRLRSEARKKILEAARRHRQKPDVKQRQSEYFKEYRQRQGYKERRKEQRSIQKLFRLPDKIPDKNYQEVGK